MADIKIDTIRHEAIEEPSGLALQCSCGTWAMLFRNSLGLDAEYEHAQHATRAIATAAAESRGRAAGYAEAVQALAALVEANYHPASNHGVLLRSVVTRMEKLATAARATTEETPR